MRERSKLKFDIPEYHDFETWALREIWLEQSEASNQYEIWLAVIDGVELLANEEL